MRSCDTVFLFWNLKKGLKRNNKGCTQKPVLSSNVIERVASGL